MARAPFDRQRRRSAEDEQFDRLLDAGDLEGLADLLNEQFGSRVAEVVEGKIRMIPGAVNSDVGVFRRLVREDPGGALDLVRETPHSGSPCFAGPERPDPCARSRWPTETARTGSGRSRSPCHCDWRRLHHGRVKGPLCRPPAALDSAFF